MLNADVGGRADAALGKSLEHERGIEAREAGAAEFRLAVDRGEAKRASFA